MADEQPSTSTPLSTDNHTYGTDAPNAPLLAPGASGRKSGTRHGSSVPVSSPSGLHAYDVTDSVREGAGAVAGGDDDGPDYGDPKVRLRRLEQLGLNREVLERGTPFMCGSVRGFVILCIALTALTCILLGYDIGVLSGAKIYIQRDFKLEDSQVELLVGILNFVSSVGGLFSGRLSDWIGRKKTVALACVIFLAGAAAMAAAPSYEVLMVGRIITGVGVGTGLTIAPLYMAELSPKRIRGALVSMNEVAINVGILLGFVAGYAFSGLSDNVSWRWMLGVGAVPPVIILLSLLIMPESPRWLVRHGRPEQALLVLLKTCDMTEAFETLAVLEDECLNTEEGSLRDIFFPDKSLRRLIIAGFGVTFFQQASGIEALVYYVPDVLKKAGITNEGTQLLANMGVGFVKLIFIFVAMYFSDRRGRRELLVWSSILMVAAFIMVAFSFLAGDILALTLIGICVFMAGFSTGFGPLTWVIASEIFPLRVRGLAVGIATFINRIVSGTIAMTYLSLSKAITEAGAFFLFAAIAFMSLIFVLLCVPETKGKTLEEIEASVARRKAPTLRSLVPCL